MPNDDDSTRRVAALGDAIRLGDLRLVRVPWWRAVTVRVWWWVWPYGVALGAALGFILVRAAARDRLESMVWLLAIVFPVGMVVAFVAYRRSQLRYGAVLCRLAVPERLVSRAQLARRPAFEPRMLSTPVLLMADGAGLGLGEGDGVIQLRELGVVLELSCSRSGRVGWCSLQFDGAVDRAPCAGHLELSGHSELFTPGTWPAADRRTSADEGVPE